MMQSGMVKQSVDFTSSIKALDGTIIEQQPKKKAFLFSLKNMLLISLSLSSYLSTYFFWNIFRQQPNNKNESPKKNAQCVFIATFIFNSRFV